LRRARLDLGCRELARYGLDVALLSGQIKVHEASI
jgi:hypothetical protein